MLHAGTINGKSLPDFEKLRLEKGKRYRLFFNTVSGDIHPLHRHRHTFEITELAGKPTAAETSGGLAEQIFRKNSGKRQWRWQLPTRINRRALPIRRSQSK